MTNTSYMVTWNDGATDETTATEIWTMFGNLDDAIEEAEFMAGAGEYFEIYDADDESGEQLYTSRR